MNPDRTSRANARVNAADAIDMLEAFRNPERGDIAQREKLAAAIEAIAAAVRQSVGGEWKSPEWIAQRLLVDAALILDDFAGGATAAGVARKYEAVV